MIVSGLLALFSFGAIGAGAGTYNIDELRNVVYEFDVEESIAGIDSALDLDSVNSGNIDELRRKILAKYPSADDPSNTFITNAKGDRFVCSVPKETENVEKEEEKVIDSYNPKYVAELIAASFYVKKCVELENGWWKYELCRGTGKSIRQFHGTKNEADWVENSLGTFVGRYSPPAVEGPTKDRQLYFEESYEGGTLCDIKDNNVRRKTIVRYECDPVLATFEAKLEQVEETSSCEYLMRVKVGSLCRLKAFLPPTKETAVKITCQACFAIEKIYTYLEGKARENDIKATARAEYLKLIEYQKSAKRVRKAMMHTKLHREWKKNKKVLSEVHDKYTAISEHLFLYLYAMQKGEVPSPTDLAALVDVDNVVQESDWPIDGYAEYDNDWDEDCGNIWYYFKDASWEKKYYPYNLFYVHVSNEYRKSLIDFNPRIHNGDPYKYDENVLIGYRELRPHLLKSMPLFIPREIFEPASMDKFVKKGNLFGGHETKIIDSFIRETLGEFARGIEPRDDGPILSTLAMHLAPSYLLVGLYIASADYDDEYMDAFDEELDILRDNAALMLDRMIVAYFHAEIQFDLRNRDVKLSFGGSWRNKGIAVDQGFESTYKQFVGARTRSEQKRKVEQYRQILNQAREVAHSFVFDQAWPKLKNDLFKRYLERGHPERERDEQLRAFYGEDDEIDEILGDWSLPDHRSLPQRYPPPVAETVVSDTEEVTVEFVLKTLKEAGLREDDLGVDLSKFDKKAKINLSALMKSVQSELAELAEDLEHSEGFRELFGEEGAEMTDEEEDEDGDW